MRNCMLFHSNHNSIENQLHRHGIHRKGESMSLRLSDPTPYSYMSVPGYSLEIHVHVSIDLQA